MGGSSNGGVPFSDPNSLMLLGALQGLGQASAPSRLPVTNGMAFGSLAGGALAGQEAATNLALKQAQAALVQNNVRINTALQEALPSLIQSMGGMGGAGTAAPTGPAPQLPPVPGKAAALTAPLAPVDREPLKQALLQIESGGKTSGVPDGAAGEIGPAQILPSTGAQYGYTPRQLRDDTTNLQAMDTIVGDLQQRYQNDPLAVGVAYNAGSGRADKWLASGRDMSVLPATTQDYVKKLAGLLPQGMAVGGAIQPPAAANPGFTGMSANVNPQFAFAALAELAQRPGLGQLIINTPQYQAALEAAKKGVDYPYDVGVKRSGFQTIRPGGTLYDPLAGGPVYGAPVRGQTVNPQTGDVSPAWYYQPGVPNAPPGGMATVGGAAMPGGAPTPPATAGAPAAAGAPATAAGGPIIEKLGPIREEQLAGVGKTDIKQRDDNIEAADAAQQQQVSLQTMKNEAQNFYMGPGAEAVNAMKSILRPLVPDNKQLADSVASFENFTKNGGTVVRQAVRAESPRAAVQEFNLIAGQLPRPEMSPMGFSRVINEFMGMNDYNIVKAQAQSAWEQQHGQGNVTGFETDWQSKVSPMAFVVGRMAPADYTQMAQGLSKTAEGRNALGHLVTQLKYIDQSGLGQFIQ